MPDEDPAIVMGVDVALDPVGLEVSQGALELEENPAVGEFVPSLPDQHAGDARAGCQVIQVDVAVLEITRVVHVHVEVHVIQHHSPMAHHLVADPLKLGLDEQPLEHPIQQHAMPHQWE